MNLPIYLDVFDSKKRDAVERFDALYETGIVTAVPCPACGRTAEPVRGHVRAPDARGKQDAEEGSIVLRACDPTFGPEFVCEDCGAPLHPGEARMASRVASEGS